MKTICVLLICAASLVTYTSAMMLSCNQSCSMQMRRAGSVPPSGTKQSFEDCMERCRRMVQMWKRPVPRKLNVAEELIDPEDLSINGHVGNGGKWGVGFEYKFKDDNEEEWRYDPRIPVRRLDLLKRAVAEELIDPENLSIHGNVGNGGQWNVGIGYTFKDDHEEEESWQVAHPEEVDPEDLSIHGNVANGGKWNLGFKYQIKDDGAEEEDWEEVDPEELSAYGNVGNGGNWNVGLRYSKVW